MIRTCLIAGTDELIFHAAELLNPKELKLVGFCTTMADLFNVFDEEGNIVDAIETLPVMPIDLAAGYEADVMVVAARDEAGTEALKYMIYRAGFQGDVIFLSELAGEFSCRTALLRRMIRRLDALGIPGSAAELGCGAGDTAWQMNALMPERRLFLFDTFEGFDPRDIEKEKPYSGAAAGEQAFRDTDKLMGRMPNPDMVVMKKGWFPLSAADVEDEKYALAHVDVCLYEPTFRGLQYFFPRMERGGAIILSGYEDPQYPGVQQAVQDLEEQYGAFLITPLGDLKGTAVIMHP